MLRSSWFISGYERLIRSWELTSHSQGLGGERWSHVWANGKEPPFLRLKGRLRQEREKLEISAHLGTSRRAWMISMGCGETPCGWRLVRTSGKDRWEGVGQTMELMQLLLTLKRGSWFGYIMLSVCYTAVYNRQLTYIHLYYIPWIHKLVR
jgi:hypothetical protein